MTHFKNNAGFFTFEVLITITLVGLFLTPLIIMQTGTLTRVTNASRSLKQLFFAKQTLYDARREQKDEPQKHTLATTYTDPDTTVTYTLEPVSSGSSLHNVEGLLREQVLAQDTTNKQNPPNSIVTFVYRPVPKEEPRS